MTKAKIGHCIRIAMALADIKPPELAKKLGASVQTISSYRAGRCPNIAKLNEVAEACDMTYDQMMALSDKAKQEQGQ